MLNAIELGLCSKRRVRPTHLQTPYVNGAWDAPYAAIKLS